MMRATRFEFEQRFWIIGLIFWIGFSLSFFDHTMSVHALAHGLITVFGIHSMSQDQIVDALLVIGAVVIFAAAALRTWATAYLRTEIVHDARQHSEALVADGPYRHTRNPLYLANFLLVAGIGPLASRSGFAFMLIATWVYHMRMILREEDGLRATQGPSYAAYLQAVPRLWPSLHPRVPNGGGQPRWRQAVLGESFIWIMGVAMLTLALTGNLKIAGLIFASSFPVYFVAVRIAKGQASQSVP